ncbi:MAG: CCA tRNA nucleotidyltransferase [Planctomycetales bacterium]|nr:CCA tRNA nucleotidyltransferase [Planctomycetales bacterium]
MTKIGPLFDSASEHSEKTRFSMAEATRICARLHECGHTAYFAGGCVRDALLGREPKDFDVATDATPDRVREIFGKRKTLAFGASFGVIGVLPATDSGTGAQPTEVATFRSDGQYSDGRRPDKVHYGDAMHDALRRDFTINGLFFDPAEEKVIDYVGGQADLAARRLRTIGAAEERFHEDKLRMLRAVRFATTLGFELDGETKSQIVARADEISVVSAERIGAEVRRIVSSVFAPRGLELLLQCGLAELILPEMKDADPQKLVDYLGHRETLAFDSSMALIILVVAGRCGHSEITDLERTDLELGALIEQISLRWRLSSEETRRISFGINRWRAITSADEQPWSSVQPMLIDRDIDCAMHVAETVCNAEQLDPAGVQRCRAALRLPPQQLDPVPLVTGQTLQNAGYKPGPQFRRWLLAVRNAQLDGVITTEAEAMEMIATLS